MIYFVYQFERVNEYLKENKGMTLNAIVKIRVVNLFDEIRDVVVRTRSYTSVNETDLRRALKRMRPDFETRVLDMGLYQSGLIIDKGKEIHTMYNRYNPTRAGKYIDRPAWIKSKRACTNSQNQDDKCLNIQLNALIIKLVKRNVQKSFSTTGI